MLEEDFKEFKGRLQIVRTSLDTMCIEQPFLYQEVSNKVAEARAFVDTCKLDTDTNEGITKQRIRNEAEGGKITDKAVAEKFEQDENHVKLKEKAIEAKKDYDVWSGLLEAYNQRASMLKLLVRLSETELYNIQNSSITEPASQYEQNKKAIQQGNSRRRRRSNNE